MTLGGEMSQKDLFSFQKRLYEETLAEVSYHLSRQPKAIVNYQKEFNDSLPPRAAPSSIEDLLKAVVPGSTILFGDFHTLASSQRAVIRLISLIKSYKPQIKLQIGVEFLRSEHSGFLAEYQSGKISESELLTQTEYSKNWGFPWKYYQQILQCAKDFDIEVFAFNEKRAKTASMKSRDEKIAKRCMEVRRQDHGLVQLVIIGEHHLASGHLPLAFSKFGKSEDSLLRVFNNIDTYYFQLQKIKSELHSEVMKVDSNTFCVLNTAPWIKWKSLSIWVESSKKNLTDDDFNEFEFDSDHLFLTMASELSQFLKIPIEYRHIENFNLTKTTDIEEVSLTRTQFEGSSFYEQEMLFESFRKDGYFYVPESRRVVICDDNPHHLAELAGQHIFSIAALNQNPSHFMTKVLRFAFASFSSKIYAPSRIVMSDQDHVKFLSKNQLHTKSELIRRKRISSKLALRFWRLILSDLDQVPDILERADRATSGDVSKLIGKSLGVRMYTNYMSSASYRESLRQTLKSFGDDGVQIDLKTMRKLFLTQLQSYGHSAA